MYPIVVYSHDVPRKKQPSEFRVGFADGDVLRFRYRVMQLNRLPWRRFLKARNPVASALMAKVKIAERDRPRVKLECLRLMVTLGLDPARMWLIGRFVDAYLRLDEAEERPFVSTMEGSTIAVEQQKAVMEYVTSWEQRGIEQGLQRGRVEGELETMRAVLQDILETRFQRALIHRALIVESVSDLGIGGE